MNRKVLIIAEAGVNHNGNIENAKKLAFEAKMAGADIVKFQTAKLDSLVSKHALMADYQINNMGKNGSQKDMLRNLLLSFDEFVELEEYCRSINIQFLSTPFDIESIDFLDDLNIPLWKIPSGEITNYPYIKRIGMTGKPVILSTGMCNIDEIRDCVEILKSEGTSNVTILHCTTQYPTDYSDVNLNAMNTLYKTFGCDVGYSDHTCGIEIPIAAVAMGATVIEKHFTLDRNMDGPDHKASIEPYELQQMVKMIRNVEVAFGDGEKRPRVSELSNIAIARKSIVAKVSICRGEKFTEENITTKRPGNGMSPMKWNDIIGKTATRNYEEDELIEENI